MKTGCQQNWLIRLRIKNWPAFVGFSTHFILICCFTVVWGIFNKIPDPIGFIFYGVALVETYAKLIEKDYGQNSSWGARLALLHGGASITLLVAGFALQRIPFIGSPVGYISLIFFYILNLPGVPLAKLLPYLGKPYDTLWMTQHYTVLIASTATWLFTALMIGRKLSKTPDRVVPN